MKTTFTAISDELWDKIDSHPQLTLAQKHIALRLIKTYNRKHHTICISIRKLAKQLNCSTRTVRLAINRLEEIRFLEKVKHIGKGKNGGDYCHYKLPKVEANNQGILVYQGVVPSTTGGVVPSTTPYTDEKPVEVVDTYGVNPKNEDVEGVVPSTTNTICINKRIEEPFLKEKGSSHEEAKDNITYIDNNNISDYYKKNLHLDEEKEKNMKRYDIRNEFNDDLHTKLARVSMYLNKYPVHENGDGFIEYKGEKYKIKPILDEDGYLRYDIDYDYHLCA